PLMVGIRADYFGAASFGTIMGLSSMIVMLGMTAGPLFCGWLYDTYGNYDLAFTSVAIASAVGSLCFWFAKPPQLASR
ncbi:MAG: MFS transporter, partial [Pseudomonadales bacterium]